MNTGSKPWRPGQAIAAPMPGAATPGSNCSWGGCVLQSIDTDKSGSITAAELEEGLRKQGSPLAQKDLEGLLASIDVDSSGSIDYEEFLAATVNLNHLEKEDTMKKAFDYFDADKSGSITREELQEALKVRGPTLSRAQLREGAHIGSGPESARGGGPA